MKKSFYPVVLLVVFLVNACGSKHSQIVSVNPKFRKYVAAYSSGMQSRKEGFEIQLSKGIDSAFVQKNGLDYYQSSTFLKEIITISPEVDGEFSWSNDRTISFTPTKTLESNTLYTISLELEELMPVESGFEEFTFQVATYEQLMDFDTPSIEIMDDYNLEFCRVYGTFSLSDEVEMEALEGVIQAVLNGKKMEVTIYGGYEKNYHYYVDDVPRSQTEEEISVTWDGKRIQSQSKGFASVKIPPLGDFKVSNAAVQENEVQIIELAFSEPILSEQKFDGLISIGGVSNLTFSVAHNLVSVFLPHHIEGDYKLEVHPGIKNVKGHKMNEGFSQQLTFRTPNPRVRIEGEGSILPDSKGLIFPFETIALKSVTVRIQKVYENNVHHFLQVNNLNGNDELLRFGKTLVEKKIQLNVSGSDSKKWTQHVLNLENWIRPEQGAIYRIGIKFEKSDAMCDCEELPEDADSEDVTAEPENSDWSEDKWSSYNWDEGYDSWDYNDSESPCVNSYYYGKAISRNILASNIGIMFKLDEYKNGHAILTNMLTAEPLANASIEFVDYTKQLIAGGTTNSEGMLTLKLPRKPFLLVAKNGKQRGYLKLGYGYSNSLSKFEVDGEVVQNDIKGFIYGERGVWRPGDSLFLNFVLQDLEHKLPDDHPVKFTLKNPNDQIIAEKTVTQHLHNHYDFRTVTSSDAETGVYLATVTIGQQEFTKNIRIETVKPNRLKIKLNFPDSKDSDSVEVQSAWLHGAPASDLRASISVEFKHDKTKFEGYSGFEFDSPIKQLKSNSLLVFDEKLNKEGKGKFKFDPQDFSSAPGLLRAVYTERVFEKSGNFSIDRMSKPFSPFKRYVGLGVLSKNGESITNGKKHKFPIVLVDENGKKVNANGKLHVKIYRMEWRWWYEQNDENHVNFLARNGNRVVYDTIFASNNGDASFLFGLNDSDYGRFMVTVTDEEFGHQTGGIISIDYPSWNRENGKTNEFASMLQFSCDKKSYVKGEVVKVSFPSPAAGKALISIETRKKIVKKFWVNTVKGETTATFETTAEMAPNAFVHVTLIQPHESTVNDLPIRMYGIVPIIVDDPKTHLQPKITVAKEWKPETKATVTVNENSGQAMTYTLAIVDDGLLNLTRFSTPNPWNSFFAKEALGVRTWDMYDDVIGAYSGKLDRLLSIGGDGSADDGAGPKANRFKPMVHFLGPFHLPAGSKKTHMIDLPTYIGSVRVMVVGHNEIAYGNAEETVQIKKPLMLLGTLPRLLAVGETIQLPVEVFAMDKKIKDVQVDVSVNGLLALSKGSNRKISFSDVGDQLVNFELKIAEEIGVAKIKLIARSGSETAHQEFEVDVRSSNPRIFETKTLVIEPGKSAKVDYLPDGIKGSNHLTVEMSNVPSINLSGRMEELIHYPYGCIEQTTSTIFPQLLALDVMDCAPEDKSEMSKNIKAGLRRLQSFQTSEGGFSYWSGESSADPWGTNYAGHFFLEAENRGYVLPNGLKNAWISFQKNQAQNWENDASHIAHNRSSESHQLTQAYRLYTLALAGESELSAMNRLRETVGLKSIAKWRLAAAYYLAGQHEIAQHMVSGLNLETDNYRELGYTYGSGLRDKAMIVEACQLIDHSRVQKKRDEIASVLASNTWLSTQETSYCLLSMMVTPGNKNSGINGSVEQIAGKSYTLTGNKKWQKISFNEEKIKGKSTYVVKNNGSSRMYVTSVVSKIPKRGNDKSQHHELQMTVTYTDLHGKKLDLTKMKQGTDFIAEVKVFNPSKLLYNEMSLQHIFPCGWEILNTRFMDENETTQEHIYQDIRDDQVNSFFDLAPQQSINIKIQLNASYLGKFYVPSIVSSAMYKKSIFAQEKGFWTEVIRV